MVFDKARIPPPYRRVPSEMPRESAYSQYLGRR